MVKYSLSLLFIGAITVASCNFKNEASTEETNVAETAAPTAEAAADESGEEGQETVVHIDAATARLDSMMHVPVDLPPVYYHNVMEASKEATEKFTALSKTSKGNLKIVVSSKVVAEEISKTIDDISVPGSDLLILIDKTYSMNDDIDDTKKGLDQILTIIKKYKNTRLAIAVFGDKNTDGEGWFQFRNFETQYDSARSFVENIKVSGGGDLPESVYDAFFKCNEQKFWKSIKKRNMILIGDAPPLEKPLSDFSVEDMICATKESKIKMNFYPIVIMPEMEEVKLSPAELATYKTERLATALYPNPSTGPLNISMQASGSYHVELYNSGGVLISDEPFFGLYWSKDLGGNLPNGTYVARIIRDDHKFETMKFVLQR